MKAYHIKMGGLSIIIRAANPCAAIAEAMEAAKEMGIPATRIVAQPIQGGTQ